MNRADEARRQAPQHGRLRPHRPAAPAGVQPGGDLPLARAPRRAPGAPQAGDPRRRDDRGAEGGRRRSATSTSSTTTSSPPRSSRTSRRSSSTRRPRRAPSRSSTPSCSSSRDLIKAAARVRASDTDRKWSELRTILEDNTLAATGAGDERRKLIVFTEHRDTLDYLARRIGSLLGRPEAVKAIHGGVRRGERRQITEEFTQQPGLPGPARHRRRRRGPEPPGRPPDGQLRPAVEPEPDRAALRPHPPHRPAARSAACGTSSPTTPARARSSLRLLREDRGAAQGLRRQGVRRARRRRSARRRCARC